jgi:hypothetical protein
MRISFHFLLLVTVLLSTAARGRAADQCCACCGCRATCEKVCRLVCEEKKTEIVCWGCKCEPFCVPGRSCEGGQHCETVCANCDKERNQDAPHAQPKAFVWTKWFPGGAKVYAKKKLMKMVVTRKTPSYKWVVEDLCPACRSQKSAPTAPPGAEVAQPPGVYAAMLGDAP